MRVLEVERKQGASYIATETALTVAGFGDKVEVRAYNHPSNDGEIVVYRRGGSRVEIASEVIFKDDIPEGVAARILAKVQSADPSVFDRSSDVSGASE